MDKKPLKDLDEEIGGLRQPWIPRCLKNESHPPKEELEHEMVSLALINQELIAEVLRLQEQLAECEEARECAWLMITHLEDQLPRHESLSSSL